MYRLNEELIERLSVEARKYSEDKFELFAAELGWEDWMNEFTEAEEGNPISDNEGKEIDKILKEIFRKAHL